ncbi:MAG: peptidase M29 [Acidimicrobiia bacterium]|nr:peptidase M29 [Acidimicrobiia bacterium]
MLVEQIESKWIEAFAATFELCGVEPGDVCAVLSESQSRAVNVQLSDLALQRLGAKVFHVIVPTPAQTVAVPVRSTGASDAIGGLEPVVKALASSVVVADCTVEGLLHAPELPAILGEGARVLMVSNEHPELLERLVPDPALEAKVKAGTKLLRSAETMTVTSPGGTDLTIDVANAPAGSSWGYTSRPGTIAHWPGGLCLCFPAAGSVNGTLVLDAGDVNLTFKRYLESPIRLTVVDDYITDIEGDGLDAALMSSYFEAWDDLDAYAVSHVGWGMNPAARWDALTMYDRSQVNGTELRAFSGNFLYSTGANEVAGRHTLGHFDLPMRRCTVELDGVAVVSEGVLQGELA